MTKFIIDFLRSIVREGRTPNLSGRLQWPRGLVTLCEAAVRKMLNGENTFDEIIKGIAEKTQVARGMRLQTLIMSRPLKFIFHGKFYCFHS